MRPRKKPSRRAIEEENEALRDALEQIADILEDVGILETQDEDNEDDPPDDPGEPEVIEGTAEKVEE